MNEKLNQIEIKAFTSINASIGWLGVTASPFCAQVSSHLQKQAPNATIKEMIQQNNLLRKLKKLVLSVHTGAQNQVLQKII